MKQTHQEYATSFIHSYTTFEYNWSTLIELYKFRNSEYDTGLKEYIEEVLSKPLPGNFYSRPAIH